MVCYSTCLSYAIAPPRFCSVNEVREIFPLLNVSRVVIIRISALILHLGLRTLILFFDQRSKLEVVAWLVCVESAPDLANSLCSTNFQRDGNRNIGLGAVRLEGKRATHSKGWVDRPFSGLLGQ